jgi:acyl carrier protein
VTLLNPSAVNPTEALVARMFSEVLERESVGLDDDLFELGGDSFDAVRLALKLDRYFKIEVAASLLEEAASVRAIAVWVDRKLAETARL